ncbi:type IVB secretion system protein IcmH/DotU [Neptunomonas sp.]|uniref:type IVB secretion system protein IcmH/DotU n=1 Tax=Neptunomonas sp. TaxID=1971898 RepID=UPI0025EB5301|nr:type IVB secretion system protein IcmH/DotU [Neptunomonas sp.]
MSADDPFSNDHSDRTIIRPMPGGKAASFSGQIDRNVSGERKQTPSYEAPAQSYSPPQGNRGISPLPLPKGSGLNLLVDNAYSLLMLASQLRNSAMQSDITSLRNSVIHQIRLFEDTTRSNGLDQDETLTARYMLCTFLDESVLKTPWGSDSDWASQTLLSTFHNETWGGEKFFLVLDNLKKNPAKNLEILELIYICLSFGFEGKYGVSDRGLTQLVAIQDDLFKLISLQRGDFERELSPHWRGVPDTRNALIKYVPLWVVVALSGMLLLLVYSGFRLIVGATTEPVIEELNQIKQEQTIELRK